MNTTVAKSISALAASIALLAAWFLVLPGNAAAPAGNPKANGRVIIVEREGAVESFNPQPDVVREMIATGVRSLAGTNDTRAAWRTFATPRDVVGIKVVSAPGRNSGTRPAVVQAVVEQLIKAGVPATNLVIWDRHYVDLRLSGFVSLAQQLGVRCLAATGAGWDSERFYENALLGRLVYGDLEFNLSSAESTGKKSYVSKLLTRELTVIINITPMLNHNFAGVTGNLLSLASASTDNFIRFENDGERLAAAVPEIYALPLLGDRVALNITDGLICQYEGGESSLLHYSAILNQLRFSTDPVALDWLSLEEIEKRRQVARPKAMELFQQLLRNAALLEIGQATPEKFQIVRVK
jgi:uncharacterized protein (DUF362 family)